jgi:O-antigen/teichoic acid export membrane protein
MIRRSISQAIGTAQSANRARRFLTLKAFDVSTEAGRSDERHRRIALSSATGIGSRIIASVTMLVSLPLTVRYLGDERYGLWMTIGSLVSVLGVTDLGLGYGVINRVSEADGAGDRVRAARIVASAFLLLSAIAAVIVAALAVGYRWIDWAGIYNVSRGSLADLEAGPSSAVFLACFALGLPLTVIGRSQVGYQEGHVANTWEAAGNALGLLALLAAIWMDAGLPWLVLAVSGSPVVVRLASAIVEFAVRRPWLAPRPSLFEWAAATDLLRVGVWYFVIQVSATVAFALDNLIIARMGSPVLVAVYSVVVRLFGLLITTLSMVQGALWPAYGESIARGDVAWARKMLRRSMGMTTIVAGLSAVALAAAGPWLVARFIDPSLEPDHWVVSGVAAWSFSVCLSAALAVFLQGAGAVRLQAMLTAGMAVVAFGSKVLGMGAAGIAGVAWAGALSHFLVLVVPALFAAPRLIAALGRTAAPAVMLPNAEAEAEERATR